MDVDIGLGKGLPVFKLDIGKGQTVTILASRYRVLVDAGFAVNSGDRVSVEAHPSAVHKDAYVAARIINITANRELLLRDEMGTPVGGYGPGFQWRGGRCSEWN